MTSPRQIIRRCWPITAALSLLLAGCPSDGDGPPRGASLDPSGDVQASKSTRATASQTASASPPRKPLALARLRSKPTDLFSSYDPKAAGAAGFGAPLGDDLAGAVLIIGGTLASEVSPPPASAKAPAAKVGAFLPGAQSSYSNATTDIASADEGLVGADGGLMVWRYVETTPNSIGGRMTAKVGQVGIVGGGQYETALAAISTKTKTTVAMSPSIAMRGQGKVSATESSHHFVLPTRQLFNLGGRVVLAMVASRGDGIHNGLPVAMVHFGGGALRSVQPVAEGWLSGRRYLSRGKSAKGEIATQLNFVAFDSRNGCMSLEVLEAQISGNRVKEALRFGGCAVIKATDMTYQIDMICKLSGGGQEQCKKVDGTRVAGTLKVYPDGVSFKNRTYQMLPLDKDVKPTPSPRKPEQPPVPEAEGPDQP